MRAVEVTLTAAAWLIMSGVLGVDLVLIAALVRHVRRYWTARPLVRLLHQGRAVTEAQCALEVLYPTENLNMIRQGVNNIYGYALLIVVFTAAYAIGLALLS